MVKCSADGKFASNRFVLSGMLYNSGSDRFKTRTTTRWSAAGGDIVIFYTNSDGIKRSRVRHYLMTKYGSFSKYPRIYLVEDDSPKFADLFAQIDYLGIDHSCVLNIEELPKPPRAPKTPRDPKQKITDGLYFDNIERISETDQPYVRFAYSKVFEIDPTGTYYYVPIRFATPEIVVDKKTISMNNDQLACFIKYAVAKKIIPPTTKEIIALNRKTRHVMKVGTWVNVAELAYKAVVKSEVVRIEQKLYENDRRVEATLSAGNFGRMFSSYYDRDGLAFFKELENTDTKKFFEELRKFYKATNQIIFTPVENTFINMFQIKSKMHSTADVSAEEIHKTLSGKYMDIFVFADCYSNENMQKIARLINFIDKQTAKTA
jgi:hypothetical protein